MFAVHHQRDAFACLDLADLRESAFKARRRGKSDLIIIPGRHGAQQGILAPQAFQRR
jgi:hypothetical protein